MRFYPVDNEFFLDSEVQSQIYFRRDALIEILKEMLDFFHVVLIAGQSGIGKTSLAVDLCNELENNFAWISVTASERKLDTFLQTFLKALSPFLDETFEKLQIKGTRREFEDLFLCVEEKIHKRDLLLVLDDVHRIYKADWFENFFVTILHFSDKLRFLLVGRTEPPFSILKFRASQIIGVLQQESLIFTFNEAFSFLRQFGIDEKTAQRLFKESNGKISKIRKLLEKELNSSCF
ncbi:MAG: AAA family ATPase [Pyrinomonadaceae bacterium]|nr:AAA family ATPase [Pyrinomonadaceae bacterium]MCX7639609.1 AAA family ATPase [Pyrinomonadaceae bacterium]